MDWTRAAISRSRVTVVALLLVAAAGVAAYLCMPRAAGPSLVNRSAMIIAELPGAGPERVEQLVTDPIEAAAKRLPELDFVESASRAGVSRVLVHIQARYADLRPIWDRLQREVRDLRTHLPNGVVGPFVNEDLGDVYALVVTVAGDGRTPGELLDAAEQVRAALLLLDGVTRVSLYGEQSERPRPDAAGAGHEPTTDSLVTSSGRPAVALAVATRAGGRSVGRLDEQVRAALDRVQADLPHGVELEVVSDLPADADAAVAGFSATLLASMAAAVGLMLLLTGLRRGVAAAALIPFAALATIWIMSVLHIGLDPVSVGALIVVLGLLAGQPMAVTEWMASGLRDGKAPQQAAVDAVREVRAPLLLTALIVAAALLPAFLAHTPAAEYTAPLFEVVAIGLASAWVLALTMTPLLGARLMAVPRPSPTAADAGLLHRLYRAALLLGLRNRLIAGVVLAAAFFGAMSAFIAIPEGYFPAADKSTFTADLELPPGTPIGRTRQAVASVERMMRDERVVVRPGEGSGAGRADRPQAGAGGTEGIVDWVTYTGQGGPRFDPAYEPEPARPEHAVIIAQATSTAAFPRLFDRLEAYAREELPEARLTVRPLAQGPPLAYPVEVRVYGPDADGVRALADLVRAHLETLPGVAQVADDWGGPTRPAVPEDAEPGVPDQSGTGAFDPTRILRRNRLPTATVCATLDPGATAHRVVAALTPWLSAQRWAAGYGWELGGEREASRRAEAAVAAKLPFAGALIVLLLLWRLNSVRCALIALAAVPLGLIGAVVGLLVAGSAFGFATLVGLLALAGMAAGNTLALVDRVHREVEGGGPDRARALVEAVQGRLRPVLGTTVTTVGALIPLWVRGGPLWQPVAAALVFGLLATAVLALGLVPLLYSALFRVGFRDFRY